MIRIRIKIRIEFIAKYVCTYKEFAPVDGWMVAWMDNQAEGWMDSMDEHCLNVHYLIYIALSHLKKCRQRALC